MIKSSKQNVVLDKYLLGKEAYENDEYVTDGDYPNRLTGRKITSTVYYLKNYKGWSLEQILEYFTPKFSLWYEPSVYTPDDRCVVLKDIKSTRFKQIHKEFNREYNTVKFCQKEIDFIKSFNLNTARLIFLIMCVCKQYNYKHFTFTHWWFNSCYDYIINSDNINNAIHNAYENEIIYFSKNGAIRINDDLLNMYDGNSVFEFNNLGNLSMLFGFVTGRRKPDSVIFCEQCGLIVEKTGNRQKYCEGCKINIERERQRIKWHKYKSNYK